MKTICFYFQLHQPFRFRKYRFFDIGENHQYYNDYLNKEIMQKVARKSYLPANELMLRLIEKNKGKFKIAYSITGTAIEQFEKYAPEVIESFKKLADTNCIEFLSETYYHTLASLTSDKDFEEQLQMHSNKIQELFGLKPQIFRNTELIYNDKIAEKVYNMGFKALVTEGTKQLLGWRSPNSLYYYGKNPELKILLRNYELSDDIAFRFCNQNKKEARLSVPKYINKLKKTNQDDKLINIFIDYETIGEHLPKETGIFDFMEELSAEIIKSPDLKFNLPAEIIKEHKAVADFNSSHTISWADQEKDITAWLGNEMQKEAFEKLYELSNKVKKITNLEILTDWRNLQTSDHFYYMSTKIQADGSVHEYFSPFSSPYQAFINYMNILNDFEIRINQTDKSL